LIPYRLVPVVGGLLAQRGIDVTELLEQAGLPLSAVRGELTAPLRRVQAFIALAATRLEAPLFGIELASTLSGGVYGMAEFVVRAAATLEMGLRTLCELAALINPAGKFQFVSAQGGNGRLHYSFGAERDTLGMHLNEFTIAYVVRQLSSMHEGGLSLVDVWFSHQRIDHAAEVARHFECPVRFQARDCGFSLSRTMLARAPRTADPLLYRFLHEQARAQLGRLSTVDTVSQLVRVLEARLPTGDLDAAAAAQALALTPRTLQRQLADAGTTYRDVLAHVRHRRRAELSGGGVGEAEIARQLGFADARAMRRSLDS